MSDQRASTTKRARFCVTPGRCSIELASRFPFEVGWRSNQLCSGTASIRNPAILERAEHPLCHSRPFAEVLAAFGQGSYIVGGRIQGFPRMPQTPSRRRRQRKPLPGLAEEERPFVHDEIVRGIAAKRVKDLIDRGVLGARQVFRVIPDRTFSL